MPDMAKVAPLPLDPSVLTDARGGGRAMRVTWHHEAGEAGLAVLSLWQDSSCVATFRVEAADVPALVQALVEGLAVSRGGTARSVS